MTLNRTKLFDLISRYLFSILTGLDRLGFEKKEYDYKKFRVLLEDEEISKMINLNFNSGGRGGGGNDRGGRGGGHDNRGRGRGGGGGRGGFGGGRGRGGGRGGRF